MLLAACGSSDSGGGDGGGAADIGPRDTGPGDAALPDGAAPDAPIGPSGCEAAGGACGCAGGCNPGYHPAPGALLDMCPQPCDSCGACSQQCCLPDDVPDADAGPPLWEPIDHPVARLCPLERAIAPGTTFPVLDDWRECGAGCRELWIESVGEEATVLSDAAWYDETGAVGFLSIVHVRNPRFTDYVARIVGTDGVTRAAWRGFGRDTECHGAYFLGSGRWVLLVDVLTDPPPFASALWQGAIEGDGRPINATSWTSESAQIDSGEVGPTLAGFRMSAGRELGRLHLDGRFERLPAEDREILQTPIAVVGTDVVYHTYHVRNDRFSVRLRPLDGPAVELVGDDDELRNPAAMTDGNVLAWTIGVRSTLTAGGYGRAVLFESPFSADPAAIRPRRVVELPGQARGDGVTGHGYVAMGNDRQMTVVRLADGARWDFVPERGTKWYRPLYVTRDELVFVYYEGTPTGAARAIRFLRWDALGSPDG